jgi:O-succinylbenzoic acid--CoA ligase
MTFHFNTHSVHSDKLSNNLKTSDEFEYQILKQAREWLTLNKGDFEFQTSGSTGSPKKITFTRMQVKASVELTKSFFNLEKGQKALLCLDPSFIAGKMMIVRAIEIGMDLICVPPAANPLKDFQHDTVIDFAALVPYQLEGIVNDQAAVKRLAQINKVIVGGAIVSNELSAKLQSLSTTFFETYGMTETLTHIAVRALNPLQEAFQALPGIKLLIDDRSCLTIQASHLSPEVIRTNDVVHLITDNAFVWIGRNDNIINTAGVKVSPEEVERKIASLMFNQLNGHSYFIGGVPDKKFGQKIVLFIETDKIPHSTIDRICEHLRGRLQKWEAPKEIVCLPLFERTASGKINRRENIKPFGIL